MEHSMRCCLFAGGKSSVGLQHEHQDCRLWFLEFLQARRTPGHVVRFSAVCCPRGVRREEVHWARNRHLGEFRSILYRPLSPCVATCRLFYGSLRALNGSFAATVRYCRTHTVIFAPDLGQCQSIQFGVHDAMSCINTSTLGRVG